MKTFLVITIPLQAKKVNILINNNVFYEVSSICNFIKEKQPHLFNMVPFVHQTKLEVSCISSLNFSPGPYLAELLFFL